MNLVINDKEDRTLELRLGFYRIIFEWLLEEVGSHSNQQWGVKDDERIQQVLM